MLKARTNAFTIELIFFDGEEATLSDWGGTDHTYGSQHYVDTARKAGTLSTLKALVLVDMIADRSPRFMRESNSTPWLTDIIWSTAQKMGHGSIFVNASTPIEDDHIPFLSAGVPRPTSSTSTTRRGTRPPTRSTRRRRGACRLSVMWWSRRSRRSRRGCHDKRLNRRIRIKNLNLLISCSGSYRNSASTIAINTSNAKMTYTMSGRFFLGAT